MKQVLKAALLLLLFSSCGNETPPKSLWSDYQARQALKSEKYEDGLLRYFQLLESDGQRYATHSNIGVLLNKMQKPEDALKSLQHALKLAEEQKDPLGLFAVNYNLGVYFGALKRVSEALASYQAALEINPASLETKTNIELLIRQQEQEKQEQKKNQEGQGEGQNQPENDPQKGDKGEKPQQDQPKDGEGEKQQDQPRQQSPKYEPRPFKGDQLSEGDVKKILGELKNQEQKIRANFDKNEKGKSRDNEKDW